MATNELSLLNDRYGVKDELVFCQGPGGLPVADVRNSRSRARISLQGAQVLEWAPHAEPPVIWLSPSARFAPQQSIRGGVPICWPWFGTRDSNSPSHGFVRTATWEVVETGRTEAGATRLRLKPETDAGNPAYWPHRTSLELAINVGETLELELTTGNDGPEPIVISEALHTYFHVSDVRRIQIHGLDRCAYLDKVDGNALKQQHGAVVIAAETDRIYLDSTDDCLIEDPGSNRCLRVAKWGSRSTVVWNPWAEKAAQLGDMGDPLRMVCVESGNAAGNAVTLDPGDKHSLGVRYSVEKLV